MAYPRLSTGGLDFTVTKWNSMIDSLEALGLQALGRGVLSGLDLSIGTGLEVDISDGTIISKSVVALSSVPSFTCAPSSTLYLWIDEAGTVTSTTTVTYPGSGVVCLGRVVTGVSTVTSVDLFNREETKILQLSSQNAGYCAVALTSSNVSLSRSQYENQLIEFTGTLTANVEVYVPPFPGKEWTFLDSTTGAFTVTVKVLGGTGIALTHTKTCKLWNNGVNVYRSTSDV